MEIDRYFSYLKVWFQKWLLCDAEWGGIMIIVYLDFTTLPYL